MPRRVSLPTADDLFRPTGSHGADPADGDGDAHREETGIRAVPNRPARKPSGRVRHDEKMTVYVTSAELLELEHARLALRATHGLVVDRGRLVREALALVLADFEAHGDDSPLVRRLTEE